NAPRLVAPHDHLAPGNLARDVIARFRHLGGVPGIEPAAAQDPFPLGLQNGIVAKCPPWHQKFAAGMIDANQGAAGHPLGRI
ncbi:hypothetical protein DF186_22370, partial [Enterococcus hirae]